MKWLQQGLSEPEIYGALVDKFKQIIRRGDVSYQLIGYDINLMQQSACLVVNPITVTEFDPLFIYTPVGRALLSVMNPT